MTRTHTPGPWTRTPGERFRHDQSAGVRGPDGNHGPNGQYIAAALDMNRFDKDEEVEANAALIAAAPDMLAALEYITDWKPEGWHAFQARDLACAAIAKAYGLPADTTPEQLRQVRDGVLVYRDGVWEMPRGTA